MYLLKSYYIIIQMQMLLLGNQTKFYVQILQTFVHNLLITKLGIPKYVFFTYLGFIHVTTLLQSFGRVVNHISTGDTLCPTHYYVPPPEFSELMTAFYYMYEHEITLRQVMINKCCHCDNTFVVYKMSTVSQFLKRIFVIDFKKNEILTYLRHICLQDHK